MGKKLEYKESFSWWTFFPAGLGAIGLFFSLTTSYTVGFRRLTLLKPPYSNIVVGLISVGMIVYTIKTFLQFKTLRGVDQSLELNDENFSFVEIKKGQASRKQLELSAIKSVNIDHSDEGDGQTITVWDTQNNSYDFESANFESFEDFRRFKLFLKKGLSQEG